MPLKQDVLVHQGVEAESVHVLPREKVSERALPQHNLGGASVTRAAVELLKRTLWFRVPDKGEAELPVKRAPASVRAVRP